MVTINISEGTKKRFKKNKLSLSAKLGESLSEEDFVIILLNDFEEKDDAVK